MKKNIAIIILAISTISLSIYAFAQATIAKHAVEEASIQRSLAVEQRTLAEEARKEADVARMTAIGAQQMAEEAHRELVVALAEEQKNNKPCN